MGKKPFRFSKPQPKTHQDWFSLEREAARVFSPHSPIDAEELFIGRINLLARLLDTAMQKGRHAILYGERGVGKTSLANIAKEKIFSFKPMDWKVVKRNCTNSHNFTMIWKHVFDEFALDGKPADELISSETNAYEIHKIFSIFPINVHPVIIIDEYDRVRDAQTHVQMADTIKYLSDYGSNVTIIIVGVSSSISELFGGHPSIHRNVHQIQMPHMSPEELTEILDKRLPELGMEAASKIKAQIASLSQGLPGYTHLLGQHAAQAAAKRRSLVIERDDLKRAATSCLSECDEMIREAYLKAVRSTKPKNYYKEALLACALAKTDEKGYFSASAIKKPYSEIIGSEKQIYDYARHIKEFCDEERGPVLLRQGKPKSFEYKFAEAILRPYVVLRGVGDETIDDFTI